MQREAQHYREVTAARSGSRRSLEFVGRSRLGQRLTQTFRLLAGPLGAVGRSHGKGSRRARRPSY
jgi:hypothetical protein